MTRTSPWLVVVGVVALLGGLGTVLFAEQDEAQNEEQPFSDDDEDRSDRNEQLRTGGWIVAGIGALLVLMAVVAALPRASG